MELDRIDIALLQHLQQDGRATTMELSEKVGLSPSPCHRRQKLLEEAGIIRGYVALLDQGQVGLPVSVFVTLELSSHDEETIERVETAIRDIPQVMECYEMTGANDYLLRVVCADLGAYEQFVRGMTKVGGIRTIRSTFALKRIVYRTNLPLAQPAR